MHVVSYLRALRHIEREYSPYIKNYGEKCQSESGNDDDDGCDDIAENDKRSPKCKECVSWHLIFAC